MKIYTSYFGNMKLLAKNNILAIGISRYPPTYFYGQTLFELAPLYYMFNKSLTSDEFDKMYKKDVLDKQKQAVIVDKIKAIAKGRDVALCCFEKKQIECHRYNVACWLNEAGFEVVEFGVSAPPNAFQSTMF